MHTLKRKKSLIFGGRYIDNFINNIQKIIYIDQSRSFRMNYLSDILLPVLNFQVVLDIMDPKAAMETLKMLADINDEPGIS